MKYFRHFNFILIFLYLIIVNVHSQADQNDPRLNDLFTQLPLAVENSPEKARIEKEIWTIWMVHEDAYTQHLLRQGTAEMTVGNHHAAETSFTRLIKLAPDFSEAWNKRATLHYIQNRFEDSIADIRQTLLLEPRHFGAIAGLGLNFEALGDRDAAISAYMEALRVNPHMKHIRRKLKALKQIVIDEKI